MFASLGLQWVTTSTLRHLRTGRPLKRNSTVDKRLVLVLPLHKLLAVSGWQVSVQRLFNSILVICLQLVDKR